MIKRNALFYGTSSVLHAQFSLNVTLCNSSKIKQCSEKLSKNQIAKNKKAWNSAYCP
tara:strand:+ start:293 stop:463 length:171 start_codon:yes stop_codon:yes gene_type:complete